MNNFNFFKKIKDSLITRIVIVGFIILVMLIPFSMIKSLIFERESRQKEVIREICSKWSTSQLVSGPIIDIPYKTTSNEEYTDDKGVKRFHKVEYTNILHVLPEKLDISSVIFPEERKRGLYKAIVYKSEFDIKGNFIIPEIDKLNIKNSEFFYNEANINFGLTDMRGISKNIEFNVDNEKIIFEPGLKNKDIFENGVNSKLKIISGKSINFSMKMFLKGSETLSFLPIGKETNIRLTSNWKSPSFIGMFLPKDRKFTDDGFTAEWQIFDYNREFPQIWSNAEHKIHDSSFGVELYTPVDEYQKTDRSSKYAILFIFLTFLAFFIVVELVNRKKIHPIQYILVGFSLCIFYLLLLSISEYLSFNYSYLISALSVVLIITIYVKSILNNKYFTLFISCLTAMLYGFLFVIIQLEDYSLLFGSIGLFIILAVIMIWSRKIDWYNFKVVRKEE